MPTDKLATSTNVPSEAKLLTDRFHGLLDSIPDAIVIVNQKGLIVLGNRQWEELFQYSHDELAGKPLEILMPAHCRKEEAGYLKNYFTEPPTRPMGTEFVGIRKDGTEFPGDISLGPLNIEEGVFAIAAIRDISDRKRIQLQPGKTQLQHDATERRDPVEESEEYIKAIFDANADGVLLADIETKRFLLANASICKMLGYSREELLDLSLSDIHPKQDLPRIVRGFDAQVSGDVVILADVPVKRKDGGIFFADINSARITFSGRACLLGSFRDITERKRIKDSYTRLATAVEQSAEMIVITDTKGTILYVNPAFENMTGYSRAEVIGQNPRLLKSGKHDAEFYRQLWTVLKRGEVWHGRIFNKRKDGTQYEVASTISPVRDAASKTVNYVALQRDVTRESQLESQLRQAQKMEAIGQLAGGIAHDFNNLLTVINGRSQLLMSRFNPGEKTHNELELIFKTGARAAGLTRQLLAFSRKQVLQSVVFDLNAVVLDLNNMLRRLIHEDIELSTVLDPVLKLVYADPGQIEQVIMNLVVNARDAMPTGGKLSIETANVELNKEYCRVNNFQGNPGYYVMLAVSDTGHGMSPAVQEKIFEPFFTTKPQGKGTGLGLATVFGIVTQSNGHIAVYSEIGHGTTFKVYLPPQTLEKRKSATSSSGQHVVTGKEVILVVEDEDDVRELVHEILSTHGYTVLTASNGSKALQVIQQHKDAINLLITDVVMPEMGGPELAGRIRSEHPETRVLFTSGYTDHAIVQNGVLQADVSFIQKPFTPANLTRKIREVLDK